MAEERTAQHNVHVVVNLLVAIWTDSRCFVIFDTIIVGTVVKCSVPFANWPTTTLIHKMPIETDERSVLVAFVLQKRLTLFDAELFQITVTRMRVGRD